MKKAFSANPQKCRKDFIKIIISEYLSSAGKRIAFTVACATTCCLRIAIIEYHKMIQLSIGISIFFAKFEKFEIPIDEKGTISDKMNDLGIDVSENPRNVMPEIGADLHRGQPRASHERPISNLSHRGRNPELPQ